MNAINTNAQMIQKINEVLQNKNDAVVNIVNDKLTISVFSLLEKNLKNVKEINFVIRDVRYLPQQSEIAHEFEINPTDVLFNAYDITEKNKLQHFSRARSMHDFIEKYVNVRKVNSGIRVGGNVLIIDDDFMIQGSSSLEVSKKNNRELLSNINFDSILSGSADKEQIQGATETFNRIWFNKQFSVDYKKELLASLQYVYKEHAPEFLYYFTLNELFGDQLDAGVERFERDSVRFKKTQIWNALYDFQKDCVVSAIRKLNTFGGCIIADSVGLGKTFEALAIIKYFEIGMNRVLVLTPAKLYDNWNSFRGDYKDSFLKETFNYRIMFHTDLSRYSGMSRSGQEFGTKKCNETKKAERFFKERGIKYQFVDMKKKGMSKGEFNSVAQANGGLDHMINWEGKDQNLLALIKYIANEDKLEKVLENPQVIKTPVVRNGKQSTLGYQPDVWKKWN